jgi:hypothetical protein
VQVIQDAVDNTLVFDTTVRRIDNYPDSATATATDRDRAAFGSTLNTRFNRCYHAPVTTRLSPGHGGMALSQ